MASKRKPKLGKKTVLRIIEEVQSRPCLWNSDDVHYHSRARVAVGWEEVAAVLNLPEGLIRVKWKGLRDIFIREMKKCQINSQGEAVYAGKWRHFKNLCFLQKAKVATNQIEQQEVSNSSTDQDGVKEEMLDEDSNGLDDNGIVKFDDNVFTIDYPPSQDPLPVTMKSPEEDYDLMFLKSLLPYFRQLDPMRKLRIRSKIQDVIITELNDQENYR